MDNNQAAQILRNLAERQETNYQSAKQAAADMGDEADFVALAEAAGDLDVLEALYAGANALVLPKKKHWWSR